MKTIAGKQLRAAVRDLRRSGLGCCCFHLWTDWDHPKERAYYAVVGWSDCGAESGDPSLYGDEKEDGRAICAKIAYQDRGNAMRCDFDLDFEMPYDPETGDVFDTSHPVTRCHFVLPWNARRFWDGAAEFINDDARRVREYVAEQSAAEQEAAA